MGALHSDAFTIERACRSIMGLIMGSESLIVEHGVRVLDRRAWGQSP
jgi:hypothetical protein